MKKIKEGEEFEMAGTIFSFSKNEDNSIKLKVIRRTEVKSSKSFTPPTFEEVKKFFEEKGYNEKLAKTFFDGYDVNEWKDSNDKLIKNWKMKAIQVWFKDDNKLEVKNKMVR